MSNRETRSLVRLAASASAARTLNLIAVHRRHGEADGYRNKPLFRSLALNRSIIVKHRLRPHELETFTDGRQSATKVLIPFELTDLKLGARSFFVGQPGIEQFFDDLEIFGDDLIYDREILAIIDALPSLDPFLTREKLKVSGFKPDRCYFDLTDADASAMFDMMRAELKPLIGLSFDDLDVRIDERTSKLAEKILENAAETEIEPLRLGMGMTKHEFAEGLFCWKGFIYYKWRLNELLHKVRPVSAEINGVRPNDQMTMDQKVYLDGARGRLERAITSTCRTVGKTLTVYDDAYRDLTVNGLPMAFKEFLLKAPQLFDELGERLGAVDHIISFWRYRFPTGSRHKIGVEELTDLFVDFENSLAFVAPEQAARAA